VCFPVPEEQLLDECAMCMEELKPVAIQKMQGVGFPALFRHA
jgi:hypothetical protein